MARSSAHISASATQIYPPPPTSPSKSPPHTSSSHITTTNTSDCNLNTFSPIEHYSIIRNTYARRIRILNVTRLALTVLSVAAAAAVVGCEAHTLSVYNATRLDDGFFLPPIWPKDFDLRPTQGLVVGGSVVVLMGLLYVLVGVMPVPTRVHLLAVLLSVSLSIIGLAGSIFGVAYSAHITSRQDYNRDNMQSWTCRWYDGAVNVDKLFTNGLAGLSAPAGFKRVCMESHVGFSLSAILICLETVVLVVTALCVWLELRMRRVQQDGVGSGGFEEKERSDRRFY